MNKANLNATLKLLGVSSGGEGTGPTIEEVFPAPKVIAFLVHGMNGSAGSWTRFKTNTSGTNYASKVIYLDLVLTKDTSISELGNQLIPLKNQINSSVALAITVQFSNDSDFVANQVNELNSIINMVKFIYESRTKYAAIGHSKGGLVITDYVAKHRGLHVLFTLGTPYNNDGLMTLLDWFWGLGGLTDRTVGNGGDMKRIQDGWNNIPENEVPKTFALATAVKFEKNIAYTHLLSIGANDEARELYNNLENWSDKYVGADNAKGRNFQKITPIILDKRDNYDYEHSEMLARRDVIQMAFSKIFTSL